MELCCLMGTECLFYKMKRALWRNGGDSLHNLDECNATER